MTLPAKFVDSLVPIQTRELITIAAERRLPRPEVTLELWNELRPADLYTYLRARFGQPNGVQSLLRSNDSDNLIHWDWTLRHPSGLIWFMGMNFRTEIWISGITEWDQSDGEELVRQIRSNYSAYGTGMSEVRRSLEPWVEFVNPYQRIKRTIDLLLDDLHSLEVPEDELERLRRMDMRDERFEEAWKDASQRYTHAFGLCFAVRSLLPVLAEAFVNLLLYVLARPEIREDSRLHDNLFRQPIDVRVKWTFRHSSGWVRGYTAVARTSRRTSWIFGGTGV